MILAAIWPEESFAAAWQLSWASFIANYPSMAGKSPSRGTISNARKRALKVAIAEMYVKGISTRRVTSVLEKMCGLDVSSTQVSRAAKMLDEKLIGRCCYHKDVVAA